jgi:hypothetical protein
MQVALLSFNSESNRDYENAKHLLWTYLDHAFSATHAGGNLHTARGVYNEFERYIAGWWQGISGLRKLPCNARSSWRQFPDGYSRS